MSVGWGIAMMVAGKVADNNEWLGEDFGKAMMAGGAIMTLGYGTGAFGAEAAAAEGATGTALGAGSEITGSAIPELAAIDSSAAGGLTAEGASMAPGVNASLAPGASVSGSGGLLSDGLGLESINAGGAGSIPPVSPPGSPPVPPGMSDTVKYGAMMVGGNAISSAYAAKQAKEEDERKWGRQSAYGRRNDGKGTPSSLNVGSRFDAMNNRLNTQRSSGNRTNFSAGQSGGLLS